MLPMMLTSGRGSSCSTVTPITVSPSRSPGAGLLDTVQAGRSLPPLDGLVNMAESAVRYSFSRYSLGRLVHFQFGK